MKKTLGIIGGMGPLATAYFFKKLVELTPAESDQEHIPAIILNDVTVPDRTDFILDHTKPSPLPKLIDDIKKLEAAGADCIAIPCNTAHYFYEKLCAATALPIINILDETVRAVCADGKKHKITVLATSGSLKSGIYEAAARKFGCEIILPEKELCDKVTALIYDFVKTGKASGAHALCDITRAVLGTQSDSVILGCTELSVLYENSAEKDERIFDSTHCLAKACVAYCTTL